MVDSLLVLAGEPGARQLYEVGIAGGTTLLADLTGAGDATSFGLSTTDGRAVYLIAAAGDVEGGVHCVVTLAREYAASGSPLVVIGGTAIEAGFVPHDGLAATPCGVSLVAFDGGSAWVQGYETFDSASVCANTL